MNIDLKKITSKLSSVFRKLKSYAVFVTIILVLLAYGFIVVRIRTLTSHEPDTDTVSEQLKNLKKPVIDQATIDKIQQLEESNVQVKSLFNQARDNPFQN